MRERHVAPFKNKRSFSRALASVFVSCLIVNPGAAGAYSPAKVPKTVAGQFLFAVQALEPADAPFTEIPFSPVATHNFFGSASAISHLQDGEDSGLTQTATQPQPRMEQDSATPPEKHVDRTAGEPKQEQLKRRIPLIDLAREYRAVEAEVDPAVKAMMARGHYVLGPEVARFEQALAVSCGVTFALGLNSGTDALLLAFSALGIGPGDEVIVPAMSFIASAEPIVHLGGTPVFADIDHQSYTLDPRDVARKITKRTKAIVAVHLYGLPADIAELKRLAKSKGIALVEDVAQAIGATFGGLPVGSFGDIACLSFYPTKNLGAYGDGGAVLTSSEVLYRRLLQLRDHGSKTKYFHDEVGFNSRLDEIQAAILNVKLPHLKTWNDRRRMLAGVYTSRLQSLALRLPHEPEGRQHVFHLYTIQTALRDLLCDFLEERGISTGLHYPLALHLQKALAHLGYRRGDFPQSESLAAETLSLPLFPTMELEEVEYVCAAVRDFFSQYINPSRSVFSVAFSKELKEPAPAPTAPWRVLFLGEKWIGERCFDRLQDLPQDVLRIVGVVTNRSADEVWWKTNGVYESARSKGIPAIGSEKRNKAEIAKFIVDEKVNLLISVQYPWVIPAEIIDLVNGFAINLHMAHLPEFRGFNPSNHALLEKLKMFSATLHWMVSDVDSGDKIGEVTVPVLMQDTAKSLYDRLCFGSVLLFKEFLALIGVGQAIPRTHMPGEGHFYDKHALDSLKEIGSSADPVEMQRIARALYFPPFASAYSTRDGEKISIVPDVVGTLEHAVRQRWNDPVREIYYQVNDRLYRVLVGAHYYIASDLLFISSRELKQPGPILGLDPLLIVPHDEEKGRLRIEDVLLLSYASKFLRGKNINIRGQDAGVLSKICVKNGGVITGENAADIVISGADDPGRSDVLASLPRNVQWFLALGMSDSRVPGWTVKERYRLMSSYGEHFEACLLQRGNDPEANIVGLIGIGKQGARHLRTLINHGLNVIGVDPVLSEALADRFSGHDAVRLYAGGPEIIFDDPRIAAVIIATPEATHYALVKRALVAGKHVLVEKPFTQTPAQASELVALAERKHLLLMVGHNRYYLPHFLRLKRMVESRQLGQILEVEAKFFNPLQSFDTTSTALEDLGYHQFYLINSLFNQDHATRFVSWKSSSDNEAVDLDMMYGNVPVKMQLDRKYNGSKTRFVRVIGSRFTATFDYADEPNPTTLDIQFTSSQRKNLSDNRDEQLLETLRAEAALETPEARLPSLDQQLKAFLEALAKQTNPVSSGANAISVVRILNELRILMTPWEPSIRYVPQHEKVAVAA